MPLVLVGVLAIGAAGVMAWATLRPSDLPRMC
jgi:hypothetical protein